MDDLDRDDELLSYFTKFTETCTKKKTFDRSATCMNSHKHDSDKNDGNPEHTNLHVKQKQLKHVGRYAKETVEISNSFVDMADNSYTACKAPNEENISAPEYSDICSITETYLVTNKLQMKGTCDNNGSNVLHTISEKENEIANSAFSNRPYCMEAGDNNAEANNINIENVKSSFQKCGVDDKPIHLHDCNVANSHCRTDHSEIFTSFKGTSAVKLESTHEECTPEVLSKAITCEARTEHIRNISENIKCARSDPLVWEVDNGMKASNLDTKSELKEGRNTASFKLSVREEGIRSDDELLSYLSGTKREICATEQTSLVSRPDNKTFKPKTASVSTSTSYESIQPILEAQTETDVSEIDELGGTCYENVYANQYNVSHSIVIPHSNSQNNELPEHECSEKYVFNSKHCDSRRKTTEAQAALNLRNELVHCSNLEPVLVQTLDHESADHDTICIKTENHEQYDTNYVLDNENNAVYVIHNSDNELESDHEKEALTQTTLPITLDERELKDRVVSTTLENIGHTTSPGANDVVEIIILDLMEDSPTSYVHDKIISDSGDSTVDIHVAGHHLPQNTQLKLENVTKSDCDQDSSVSLSALAVQDISSFTVETPFCKHLVVPDLCAICKLPKATQKKDVLRKREPLSVEPKFFEKFEFQTSAPVRFERKDNKLKRVINMDGLSVEMEIIPKNNNNVSEQTQPAAVDMHKYTDITEVDVSDSQLFSTEPANSTLEVKLNSSDSSENIYGTETTTREKYDSDDVDFPQQVNSIFSEVQYDWEKQTPVNDENTPNQSPSNRTQIPRALTDGEKLQSTNTEEKCMSRGTAESNDYENIMKVPDDEREYFLEKIMSFRSLSEKSAGHQLLDQTGFREPTINSVTTISSAEQQSAMANVFTKSRKQILDTLTPVVNKRRIIDNKRKSNVIKIKLRNTTVRRKSKCALKNELEAKQNSQIKYRAKRKSEQIVDCVKKKSKSTSVTLQNKDITKTISSDQMARKLPPRSKKDKSSRLESIIIAKFQPLLSLPAQDSMIRETKSTPCTNESPSNVRCCRSQPTRKKLNTTKRIRKKKSNVDADHIAKNKQYCQSVSAEVSENEMKDKSNTCNTSGSSSGKKAKSVILSTSKGMVLEGEHNTSSGITYTDVIKKRKTNDISICINKSNNIRGNSKVKSKTAQRMDRNSKYNRSRLRDVNKTKLPATSWKDMLTINAFNMNIDDCIERKPVNIRRIVRKILGKTPGTLNRKHHQRSKKRRSSMEKRKNSKQEKNTNGTKDASDDNKHIDKPFEHVGIERKPQTASDFPCFHFYSAFEKYQDKSPLKPILGEQKAVIMDNDTAAHSQSVAENVQKPLVGGCDKYIKPHTLFYFQKRLLSPGKPRSVSENTINKRCLRKAFSKIELNRLPSEYTCTSAEQLKPLKLSPMDQNSNKSVSSIVSVNRVLHFPESKHIASIDTKGSELLNSDDVDMCQSSNNRHYASAIDTTSGIGVPCFSAGSAEKCKATEVFGAVSISTQTHQTINSNVNKSSSASDSTGRMSGAALSKSEFLNSSTSKPVCDLEARSKTPLVESSHVTPSFTLPVHNIDHAHDCEKQEQVSESNINVKDRLLTAPKVPVKQTVYKRKTCINRKSRSTKATSKRRDKYPNIT